MQVQYRPQKNEISRMKFLTKTYCLCKPGFTERYKNLSKLFTETDSGVGFITGMKRDG